MAKKKRGPAPKPKPELPCHIIDTCCEADFVRKVQEYLDKGYIMSSSHACVINDQRYEYCSSYQAIMVKREFHV
jgi:hypothetical protein